MSAMGRKLAFGSSGRNGWKTAICRGSFTLVRLGILAILMGCLGCSTPPSAHADVLQSAVHECGMDHQIKFDKVGEREYSIRWVDPHADFTRFECVLGRLSSQGIRVGFIGREQIHP